MVVTQKNFDALANRYNELVAQTMKLNGIVEIKCDSSEEHFFDRIVLNEEGKVEVYKYGLRKPFSGLCFDFTIDYAECLFYIEESLFYVQNEGAPHHGIIFEFKNNKNE